MLKKRTIDIPPKAKGAWMISFADLLSLTLTFFVLLYSMSSLEEARWSEITKSLAQRLNPNKKQEITEPTEELSIIKEEKAEAKDLQYLYTIINEKFTSNEISKDLLKARLEDERLVLSLPSDVAFLPGKDELAPNSSDIINFLGDVVGNIGNHIDVVGHADPTPIGENAKYPSNWELSLSRALVVATSLKRRGYVYKINVFGRASSTLELLNPDIPENERYKFLRRVDIVIRANRAEL